MSGHVGHLATSNLEDYSDGKMFYALQRLSGSQYRIEAAIHLTGGNSIGNQNAINQNAINQNVIARAAQKVIRLNNTPDPDYGPRLPEAIAIPVRLGNKWAALVLKKNVNDRDAIYAIYADPQGPGMPEEIWNLLTNYGHGIDNGRGNGGTIAIEETNRSIQQIRRNDRIYTGIVAALNMHDLIYDSSHVKYNNNNLNQTDRTDSMLKMRALEYYLNNAMIQQKIYNYNVNNNCLQVNYLHNKICEILTDLFVPLPENGILQHFLSIFGYGEELLPAPPVTRRLKALNVIARAYSSAPYTAVIESLDQNGGVLQDIPLHISITDTAQREEDAAEQSRLDMNVANALIMVLNNRNYTNKKNLILAMSSNRNSSLDSIIHKMEPNERNTIRKVLNNQIQNRNALHDFITNNFDKIFPRDSLNALKNQRDLKENLGQGRFKIIYKPNNISQGTHVEMQAIAEIRKRYNVANFRVGLANATYQKPDQQAAGGFAKGFCCAACTAEIDMLNNIEVGGTSHTNFPRASYMPSWNVTNNPEVFRNYLTIIRRSGTDKMPAVFHQQDAWRTLTKLGDIIDEIGLEINYIGRLNLNLNLRYTEKTELSPRSKFDILKELKAKNHNHQEDFIEQFLPADNKSLQPTQNQDQPAIKGDKPVGKVTLISEANHITDHKNNISSLISQIRSGIITSDTVICLERKEEGRNLGMRDVILLGNIIKHNEEADNNSKIEIPESIQKSQIYHDALLYNAATAHGIMVRGIEGKGLVGKEKKINVADHNKERESIMANKIKETVNNGKNVIYVVGKAHVRALEDKLREDSIDVMVKENNAFFNRIIQQIGPNDSYSRTK